MGELSHLDNQGHAHMVDVGTKPISKREAVARGLVRVNQKVLTCIAEHSIPKGDVLAAARIAGIMAAKRTPDLIPLCHSLPLNGVTITCDLRETGIALEARVSTEARTGAEMEALTAVSVAALTIYDMCKSLQKDIVITNVHLVSKTGGRSGSYSNTSKEDA